MHDCSNPNIVTFHGAFLNNSGDVIMCMEYMDCGLVDLFRVRSISNMQPARSTAYRKTLARFGSMCSARLPRLSSMA